MTNYILQPNDYNTFLGIKAAHAELAANNVDVIPVQNGVFDFSMNPPVFTPDGTYSLSDSDFAPMAQNFKTDLANHNFFTNLQQK